MDKDLFELGIDELGPSNEDFSLADENGCRCVKKLKHDCTFSHRRVKRGPDNFEMIYNGSRMYRDKTNPEEDMIRWDDNPQQSDAGLSKHE